MKIIKLTNIVCISFMLLLVSHGEEFKFKNGNLIVNHNVMPSMKLIKLYEDQYENAKIKLKSKNLIIKIQLSKKEEIESVRIYTNKIIMSKMQKKGKFIFLKEYFGNGMLKTEEVLDVKNNTDEYTEFNKGGHKLKEFSYKKNDAGKRVRDGKSTYYKKIGSPILNLFLENLSTVKDYVEYYNSGFLYKKEWYSEDGNSIIRTMEY